MPLQSCLICFVDIPSDTLRTVLDLLTRPDRLLNHNQCKTLSSVLNKVKMAHASHSYDVEMAAFIADPPDKGEPGNIAESGWIQRKSTNVA